METEILKSKPSFKKDKILHNAASLSFDLPAIIEMMKLKPAWLKGELDAMILLKRPDKQIVLTTLHEGTEITSFQSNDSVTFQIIEGKLNFRTRKEAIILEKGQLLTFYDNIKYNLTTREKTVFILTIAKDALEPAEAYMPWNL
ncbi:MAG: hypothetical protein JXJ22_04950 [Bacteroidales bacterium]|nr:hypothetical protein [Bacteroidales bacterium]